MAWISVSSRKQGKRLLPVAALDDAENAVRFTYSRLNYCGMVDVWADAG